MCSGAHPTHVIPRQSAVLHPCACPHHLSLSHQHRAPPSPSISQTAKQNPQKQTRLSVFDSLCSKVYPESRWTEDLPSIAMMLSAGLYQLGGGGGVAQEEVIHPRARNQRFEESLAFVLEMFKLNIHISFLLYDQQVH